MAAARQRDGGSSLAGAWRLWQLGNGAVVVGAAASDGRREAKQAQRRQCGGTIRSSVVIVCVYVPSAVASHQDRVP